MVRFADLLETAVDEWRDKKAQGKKLSDIQEERLEMWCNVLDGFSTTFDYPERDSTKKRVWVTSDGSIAFVFERWAAPIIGGMRNKYFADVCRVAKAVWLEQTKDERVKLTIVLPCVWR